MKVICIKTFTSEGSTFIKNLHYYIVQYHKYNFYVGIIISENKTTPMYKLDEKYRCNFLSIKEERLKKLEKLNEKM